MVGASALSPSDAVGQFTPRTAQTAVVMMTPLAGKHKSNENELGT